VEEVARGAARAKHGARSGRNDTQESGADDGEAHRGRQRDTQRSGDELEGVDEEKRAGDGHDGAGEREESGS